MAFRSWKRMKIGSGLLLNLSKGAPSASFGPPGAKVTLGRRGVRRTVGLPGSGLYYTTTRRGIRTGGRRQRAEPAMPAVQRRDRLMLGFFKRLVTPKAERAFVDGCRELVRGNEGAALRHLWDAVHLADGAYLAGFLALKQGRLAEAERFLKTADRKRRTLGRHFARYGIGATMSLLITDLTAAHIEPTLRGVRLGLVEVYQQKREGREAIACLRRLRQMAPDDVVVKLSLAELLLEARPDDRKLCRYVVRLCEGVENETPIHTALLLYKARALRGLDLLEAARDTLTYALRRKKDRPDDLRRALRYERILVYEALGHRRRVRSELEKLYAEAPDYEDVAERLGLA